MHKVTELKSLPPCSLPYKDVKLVVKLLLKLYEQSPSLVLMPNASDGENLYAMTLDKIPGIKITAQKKLLFSDLSNIKNELSELDEAFNKQDIEKLDKYKVETLFTEKYFQFLSRVKPKETVVYLLGPFTVSQSIINSDISQALDNKDYRKLIIQAVCVKALWLIKKIKENSPKTTPIIMLEEPLLNILGDLKREKDGISHETVISLYEKVIGKIKASGGVAGIQSYKKCDWRIPLESDVDIISFNAYDHPNNLSIIPNKINHFLSKGGRINWAIVPAVSENVVKPLNIDSVHKRFTHTVENLIASKVKADYIYPASMVSVKGDLNELPLIFAEKALILSSQLGAKINSVTANPPQQ